MEFFLTKGLFPLHSLSFFMLLLTSREVYNLWRIHYII